jgi:hypothetical protein
VEKDIIFWWGTLWFPAFFCSNFGSHSRFFSAPFSVSRLYFSVALSQLLDKPVNATMDPF